MATTAAPTIQLTEWVPQTAEANKVPAQLVHIQCQRLARTVGVAWGMTMDRAEALALAAVFTEDHQAAMARTREAQRAQRAARKATK